MNANVLLMTVQTCHLFLITQMKYDLPADAEEEEEDLSGLHPGALLYRSAALQNFPVMADALAHGADVNWVNTAEECSTPLIQAVSAVSGLNYKENTEGNGHTILLYSTK